MKNRKTKKTLHVPVVNYSTTYIPMNPVYVCPHCGQSVRMGLVKREVFG